MNSLQGSREKLKEEKTSIYKQNYFILRKSVLFSIISEALMRVKKKK